MCCRSKAHYLKKSVMKKCQMWLINLFCRGFKVPMF